MWNWNWCTFAVLCKNLFTSWPILSAKIILKVPIQWLWTSSAFIMHAYASSLWYVRCSCTIADISCLLFGLSDCVGYMEFPPDCATEGHSACAALYTHFLHHDAPDSALPLPVSGCSAEYSTPARWHCQESTCQVHVYMYIIIYIYRTYMYTIYVGRVGIP